MKNKPLGIRVLVILIVSAIGVRYVSAQGQGTPRLVGPEWLAENMAREDVRIVDLRGDIRDYWESHIPGAVFLDHSAIRWPERGVPVKLMPPPALSLLLGSMGIRKTTMVVIYSEINHYRATCLAWALDYIKHASWAILEGGFERWKKDNRALSKDYPQIKPVEYGLPKAFDEDIRVTLDEVKGRDVSKTILLDVRPADLYSGEKGNWKRKGHIKGAVHHFWAWDLRENGLWKNREELLKAYSELGVTPDKTIIVSCGQGQMSSHTYFTLKYILGFAKVGNYDGGFQEWSNIDSLPVESGLK
jgi:thiosulfate/3-mercaptopyruvate sulfurtransferase